MKKQTKKAPKKPVVDFSETHLLADLRVLSAIVCSAGTEDEALEWLRANEPCGTRAGWWKVDDAEDGHVSVVCGEKKDRMHYLFTC